MNNQLLARISYVLIVGLISILAACASSDTPVAVPTSVPLPASMTRTPTPAIKPTSTTTSTPAPPTSIPTDIVIPVPTLTAKQVAEFVVDMLDANGGCELPCWWGIIPGEASSKATKDSLSSQGIPFAFDSQGIGFSIDIPHPENPVDYGISVSYYVRDDTVSSIKIDGEAFNLQTSKRFSRDWERYAWDKILMRYGLPSWVSLGFDAPPSEPDAPVNYKLTLFYEPLGIAVSYGGPALYDPVTQVARACPIFDEVTNISLYLVSAKRGDSITKFILNLSDAPSLGSPLEETTGMKIQTFYNHFKDAKSPVCLEELLKTTR